MKTTILCMLALTGGIFLAVQAGFNTKLGIITKHPLLAVIATSLTSTVFSTLFLLILQKEAFSIVTFSKVPPHLWYLGGLFSFIGISLYFFTIPRLGISKMISFGLSGQLLFSLVASNFGWFNLTISPISSKEIIGSLAVIIGVFLINLK